MSPKPRQWPVVSAQQPLDPSLDGRVSAMFANATMALGEDFVGITADGHAERGLFPIRPTGVSTALLVSAADAFLAALSLPQRAAAVHDVASTAWRTWSNIHPNLMRHGLCLQDLDDRQRSAALELVRATLSTSGWRSARDVMWLNGHLGELVARPESYGEWYYWLSILGTPSPTGPWGWQIDGHHLIINCFVLGDQIVLTPTFMGSEPVRGHGSAGEVRVFAAEEQLGLALMTSLDQHQRQVATLGDTPLAELYAGAFADNLTLPYAGIGHDELTHAQQGVLRRLVWAYVGRMRPGHAEVRRAEVEAHLAGTRFAWLGRVDDESPFYYRVHSPVILIEFDHQPGVAFDNDEPSRQHIHTVVRTPNGNDYGKDLLRQHHEQVDHRPASPGRRG